MVKKLHIVLMTIVICLTFVYGVKIKNATAQKVNYIVVLDAGHGGIDAGVVADNGIKESDLNLDICNKIKRELQAYCISVVMTRNGLGGLYGLATKGFKNRDMQKRKEIINNSNADLVVSVHINKCPFEYRKGAQVFYKIGDENSKNFATFLQNELNELPNADKDNACLVGDYFVLNCSKIPSVLIECGFFSNKENQSQLLTESYRQSLAGVIASAIANNLLKKV